MAKSIWDELTPVAENQQSHDIWDELTPVSEPKNSMVDNIKNTLDWVTKTPVYAYMEGQKNVRESELETKEMTLGLNNNEKSELNSLKIQPQRDYKTGNDFFKKGYVEAFRMLPMTLNTLKEAAGGAVAGAGVGASTALVAGQLGPQVALPEEIITVPTATIAGAIWGSRIGAAKKVFELEAGGARSEFKQIVDKEGNTLDNTTINLASVGVGGVNAALEMVGLNAILKTIPGGEAVLKKIGKEGIKDALKNQTVKQALAQVAKNYGEALVIEPTTEMAQEATNIIAGEITRKLNNADNTPLEQNIARILDAGVSTFGAMIFTGGVGTAAQATNILVKSGMDRQAAKEKVSSMSSDQIHNLVDNNFGLLVDDAKNVKFKNELTPEELNIKEEIETDFYNKAVSAGMKEDEALAASQIVSARAKVMADRYGEDAKKWYDSFTLQGDKQTYDPAKDNSEIEIYFQPAETAGVEKVAKAKEVFNTETTGMSFYDALLDEKQAEYYAENKKAVGEVLYISPDNYIDFAAKGNWEEYGREGTFENFRENTIAQKQTDFGKENIQKLKKIVEAGGKIDMPVLEYYQDGHFRSQEGYHRALMAKELGVEMIPVLVVNAPEQIKSVDNQGTFSSDTGNIYYQSSLPEATVDWTDKFDKIPTFEEIKSYINELVEKGTKFKTLSPDWNIDIKGGQRVKNKLISTGNYKKLSRAERERHNKYITGITELINNSKYSHSAKNNKTGKKPNVEKYHYFTANVKIGDKVYEIVLDTEQYKKESEKKPQTVHLYNITEQKTSSSGVYAKRILKEPKEDVNNNITDNEADFNPETYYQSVYHGSPHKFDEFSLEHLGSGEGAQAYGWGLYFAGKKEIAEWYRKRLTPNAPGIIPTTIIYDGKEIDTQEYYAEVYLALETVYKSGKEAGIKELEQEIKQSKGDKEAIQSYKKGIKFIKNLDLNKLQVQERSKGQLYKVDIPEDENMLLWDKPLSEQNKFVEENINKIITELGLSDYIQKQEKHLSYAFGKKAEITGEDLYKKLSDSLFSDKAASEKLNELGIKGIKYLDGNSRTRGEGSHNYVVFDDKAIDVIETYYQGQQAPKGQIEITDQKKIITLFETADSSTLLHELGHLFLNDIITSAKTNEQAKADLQAINKWLGYNGEEYTAEQHEKFARGFEAYVMSGKAPTSMLKRAFENFRAWLKDIYNSVQDLGVEMSPETEELFRKLFTPSDAALNEERKQYKQIVAKAKEYGNKNSDSKLKSEVKGIIQELFRSILSTETGKIYDLKGAASAWAKGKKNDKFAKEAGNWGSTHSYNDLAQSIFNNNYSEQARNFLMGELFIEESLNDFDSAEFASNVLNLYSIEAWNYISNTDKVTQYADLDGIEKQYAYILNSYRNSVNRNIEQMAFYDWLESIDGVFRDDFAEQWITETNNIERFEKLDKFEQAKEIILQNVNKLVTYDGRQEYENIIRETFNGLNFLTAKDKQKLLNNILSIKSIEELKNNIDDIIDLSKTMDDVAQRRVLADKIYKVVVETKPFIKQGNKKVGKYDVKTNDFIQELKELNRLSKEAAREELYRIDVESIEENPLSFEEKLRLKFLNFKSDFVINHSSDFLSSLYEDLLQLKIAGKLSKDEIEAEKRLNKRVRMEELLNILGKKKEAKTAVKSYIPLLGNWESAINAIFNKNMRDVYSLLNLEAVVQNWAWKEKQKLNEKIALAYGIKNHEVDGKIIDNLAEKYTVYEFMEGERLHKRELNKMNIIEAYIWNKNEVLRERLLNQFGGEVGLNELFRNLSDEDIKFADVMQRTANSYYAAVNRVFIKKYGIELPKVQNYFPSVTERVSEVDLLNDYVMRSTSPSFIKGRSGNTELLMKFSNPMQLLYGHIDKTSRFIHMTETLDMYNQVFKTPIMNRAISAKYGEDTYKSLVQMLANSSYAKKGADYDGWAKPLNDLVNNWTVTKIGVKPAIAIKQLLSTVNYASEMPVSDWTKGFIKALSHPKQTIDFMKQDEYLKTRFESGGQAEFLEETINNSQFAKTKKLKDMITLNVRFGDIGAICFGGKPYIDHLISTGMSKEEAFKEFRLATMRSMQASVPSSLSNFQNNFKNPIVRVFNAFRNTSYQYARKMGDAIISYANGDISKTQMAKELFIYGCLNSFMYRTATSLAFIRLLMTGDDDDLKADFIQSIFDLNATVIPYFGEAYLYALARLTGQRGYEPKVPILDDIIDAVKEFFKDGVSFEDFMNAIATTAELGAGVPAKSIENMAAGLFDTFGGEPEKGILRTLGYSEYTAEKAIGDE